jgi:hypothetical protein
MGLAPGVERTELFGREIHDGSRLVIMLRHHASRKVAGRRTLARRPTGPRSSLRS